LIVTGTPNLGGAHLGTANLEGANLKGAHLKGADLTAADLNGGTLLRDADLTEVTWTERVPVPEGWMKVSGRLKQIPASG
jgi:uncharacterized protein YjbI with pentapeptide repeats